MATYSRIELRNAVMHDLGVLDAVEAPSAEDAVLVDNKCQQVLESLADDGLIPFDLDGDTIPAPYVAHLIRVISPYVAPAFGKHDLLPSLMPLADMGMKALRRMKSKPYYGAPATANYY